MLNNRNDHFRHNYEVQVWRFSSSQLLSSLVFCKLRWLLRNYFKIIPLVLSPWITKTFAIIFVRLFMILCARARCRDEDLAEALDSVGGDQDAEKDGIIQVQNLPLPQKAKLWMVSVSVCVCLALNSFMKCYIKLIMQLVPVLPDITGGLHKWNKMYEWCIWA